MTTHYTYTMYVNISSNKYNGSGTRKIKESKAKQIIQVVPADDDTPFGTFLIIIIYIISIHLCYSLFFIPQGWLL